MNNLIREKVKEKLNNSRKIAAFMAVVLFVNIFPISVFALTTQEKLEQAQQQHAQTHQQLEETQNNIDNLEGNKESLQVKLSNLNDELQKVSDNLDLIAQQIVEKEAQIETTKIEVADAKATEAWQYDCMKKRIQYMYEKGDFAYIEMLLSSQTLSDLLNISDYINQISEYDRNMLEEYEITRISIEEKEALLITEKADLDSLKIQAEEEQQKVTALIDEVSGTISQYSDQIDAAEAAALVIENQMALEAANIETLKKQVEEEKRLSQLAATSAKRDISEITFEEGDYYLLANLIYCEAGGEPYAGQLAVGAVVINRVLSSVYPDTVVGVIYQRKQFSPVGSGRLALALAQNKATTSCYQAAAEAMAGVTNVGNCVYFRTPIEGLTGISIGGHIFY